MNLGPQALRLDIAEAFARSLRTTAKSALETLARHLAPDVVYATAGIEIRGREEVIDRMGRQWPLSPVLAKGRWGSAEPSDDGVRIEASFLTLGAAPRNYSLDFAFDDEHRLLRVIERFDFPTRATKSTRITAPVRSAIDQALANATPIVLAYVDDEGAPSISLRGSVQVWSDTELCAWLRDAGSGLVRAVNAGRPLSLLYRDSGTRTTLLIKGRGTIAADTDTRDRVYRQVPEVEQTHDVERRGAALIIQVERIAGTHPDGPVLIEP
jgi:hypothetical protein